MGEYARFQGEQIKIGTCEDMNYLRFDQRELVEPLSGSVNPVADAEEIRFRFPWPDEDTIAPGAFEAYNRGLGLHGVDLPKGIDHSNVQFSAPGYVVSLPCPEFENGPESDHGLKIARNGHPGSLRVVQQRFIKGDLVTICECGGCGSRFRLPDLASAMPVIEAIRKEARRVCLRAGDEASTFYSKVADRIQAGYQLAPPATTPTRKRKSGGKS